MEIIRHKFKHEREQLIAHIGDCHAGLRGTDEERADEAFTYAATTKDCWLLGMGDYCEFREPGHPFYDSEECTMTLDQQLDWTFDKFKRCRSKTIGILMGNHENKLSRKITMNPIRRWCQEAKVPYLGTMAKITYEFPSGKEYTMIVHHGYGGGRKKGGKINMISDFISKHDVDSVVIGHVHQLHDWVETELVYPVNDVVARYKYCGLSGSFLRTYAKDTTGYGEEKMMEPVPTGFLVTHIDPKKGISMEKVLL